jgi:hypothetical protein
MRRKIWGVLSLVGAILLWFGRGFIEHIFFGWMVHEMNPSAAVILEYGPPLLLALLGVYLLSRGNSAPPPVPLHHGSTAMPLVITPAEMASQKEDKIFVGESITPNYLLSFFEEHTGIQAAKMAKPFIGKWMRLSGRLGEVLSSAPEHGAQLSFQREDVKGEKDWSYYITVYMRFDQPWLDRLAILRRGDQVTVVGQIKRVDPLVLNLDHCELVD